MKHKILIITKILLVFSSLCFSKGPKGTYDPRRYGAKCDGKTLDTKAIQAAIDQCNSDGGGKVYLYGGIYISGTIILKSNVTLYVEAGAILRGSNNLEDFPIMPSRHPSYTGTMVTNKMLIYAEDAHNIAICGRGTIDGRGDEWVEGPYGSPSFSLRPRIIHFRGCENILVRNIKLYNSASWVQSYQSCKNIVIDGITVDSRENKDIEKERYADARGRNTDGMDLVDCEKVRVSNCFINSGDDAICLKSFSPNEACRDIAITNCIVSCNASGIKIGTETAGIIEDIAIQNCVVFDTRQEAIAIYSVDGAQIQRINISNISIRNIKGAAITVRLGNRNRLYRENVKLNNPFIRDVTIENIQGTSISSEFGCFIAGLSDIPVKNIALRNINLQFTGGGQASASYREIPEQKNSYPVGRMFGVLPAYGFFIRHAENIFMDNIRLDFIKEDQRPAILSDNVERLEISRFSASGTIDTPELIRLVNNNNVMIASSRIFSPVPVFVSVYGDKSKNLVLKDNLIENSTQCVWFENESMKSILMEHGNIINN